VRPRSAGALGQATRFSHGRHEAISLAGDGDDEAMLADVVAERLA
jgi:hypothetical protein